MRRVLDGTWVAATPPPADGYVAGSAFGYSDAINKFSFLDDSRTILSATLSGPRGYGAGFSSITHGYIASGMEDVASVNTVVATVQKLLYSADTVSTTTSLPAVKWLACGFGSTTHGYVAGGRDSGGTKLTSIQKVDLSDDSSLTIGSTLSGTRDAFCAFESSTAGYTGGGQSGPSINTAVVDKLLFSTDAVSTLATGLSSARRAAMAFNSTTAGYVAGGYTSANVTTVDKFSFSDDSRTTLGTGLSVGRRYGTGMESSDAGYACGGLSSVVDKFAFSDDSRTTLSTGITMTGEGPCGFAKNVHA
jgi:hypothetical protein